jgi:hypothetical protein
MPTLTLPDDCSTVTDATAELYAPLLAHARTVILCVPDVIVTLVLILRAAPEW